MSTIIISLNKKSQVMIKIEGALAEHEHIWIWDHYFSLILNRLSKNDNASKNLLDCMSEWAIGFANKMYSPINELHADGALNIDKEIKLIEELNDHEQVFMIETTSQIGSWPTVHAKISDDATEEALHLTVLSLAQYFLKNNTNFFRELPMHVLGMRKFYNDEMSYSSMESVSEAPAFAFNLALKFYQDLDTKMQRQ